MKAKTDKAEIDRYMRGVMSGDIVASRYVRFAVQRHIDDLAQADTRGFHFDPYYGQRVIDFCRLLKHTTGEYAGEPFEPRMWQKFILWVLFGWRRSDGTRRFRYAYISVARGNGKSPLAAAIGNYLFVADEPIEPRSQVYAFATKEAQAKDIVFEEARRQIETVPDLDNVVEKLTNNLNIQMAPWNGSKFEPKGSDSRRSDGWILHGAIIDELHEWSEAQRGLFEKIETAMAKRRQPLCVITTTAGSQDSELWLEQVEFYKLIVDRRNDIESDEHFAFIAQIDEQEDCPTCDGAGCEHCEMTGQVDIDAFDESLWPQANPMLAEPRSPIKIDELRSFAKRSKYIRTARNAFLRYHANQCVVSFYQLIPQSLWSRGNGQLPDLGGYLCHAGFDWGWRDDLAALSLVFPDVEGRFAIKVWAWIPADGWRNLEQEPWRSWIAEGRIIATPGDTTDPEALYAAMQQLVTEYQIKTLAGDPNNCREFLTKCQNEWGIETYEFFQSCRKYNEPTREFVEALRRGDINHGNDPLLAWCANNVTVKEDSGNGYIMPSKAKSKDKIDPIVATIMAFSECKFAEVESDWSLDEIGI